MTGLSLLILAIIAVLALLALLFLIVRLSLRRRRRGQAVSGRATPADRPAPAGVSGATPSATPSTGAEQPAATPGIPGIQAAGNPVADTELAGALRGQLAGTPADGTALPRMTGIRQVVWVHDGNEALIHLDSLAVRTLDGVLLVSLDLETDQTGRQTVVTPFALGDPARGTGLLAATEQLPRGDPTLLAQWGRTLQDALWASLLALAADQAVAHGGKLAGISATPGAMGIWTDGALATVPASTSSRR
jgi:hypothetical protein